MKTKNTDVNTKVNIMTTGTVLQLTIIIIKDNNRTPFIPLKLCKTSNNNSKKKKSKTCIHTPLYKYNYKLFHDLKNTTNDQPAVLHCLLTSLHFYTFHGRVAYGFKLENPRIPRFYSQTKMHKKCNCGKPFISWVNFQTF